MEGCRSRMGIGEELDDLYNILEGVTKDDSFANIALRQLQDRNGKLGKKVAGQFCVWNYVIFYFGRIAI